MSQTFKLNVNGKTHELSCAPDRILLDVLREDLRLTGTKRGCDMGVCGTCTVLVDGEVKRACKVKIEEVAQKRIVTIEGLSRYGKLHPIQQAFIDHGAIQCGFCTPGMVLAAKALLDTNKNPSREDIKKALAGNLCRCTGYQQIFDAIEAVAKQMSR